MRGISTDAMAPSKKRWNRYFRSEPLRLLGSRVGLAADSVSIAIEVVDVLADDPHLHPDVRTVQIYRHRDARLVVRGALFTADATVQPPHQPASSENSTSNSGSDQRPLAQPLLAP